MEIFVDIAYLIAAVSFIYGLKMLSHPRTARNGNIIASAGMLIAIIATVYLGTKLDFKIIIIAILYAVGAHGIMTLNDFKALEGDKRTGINTLPVVLGSNLAALLACFIMAIPQIVVILLIYLWIGSSLYGISITILLLGQISAMRIMLKNPKNKAPWYNSTGVMMYVTGMMIAAFALRSMEVGL